MTMRKLQLYVLSLWLLFLLLIVITLDVSMSWDQILEPSGWKKFLCNNTIPVFSLVMILSAVLAYFKFDYDLKGATQLPFEVTAVDDINYEHLVFLATYIVPLISFNFESIRFILVLGILLVVMGAIYIRTDMFYTNPTLALLGFRIYRVDGSFKNSVTRCNIVVLTRTKISVTDKLSYIKLDEKIYYAKRMSQ